MLTEEEIKKINESLEDSWNQGIYKEPWGIDQNIKEFVIYQRHCTGGYGGGNCWGDEAQSYSAIDPIPNWVALDKVLEILKPNITYLEYKKIEYMLIKSNEESEYEYYGNCTDYFIRWIVLSDLYKLLNK